MIRINLKSFHTVGFFLIFPLCHSVVQGTDLNCFELGHTSGVYVGDILQFSKDVGGWWGQGDGKIFVDQNDFPMDFGTGTEDYYGYAWGHPETFNLIFNAQPLGNANPVNRGGNPAGLRVRDPDAIPFKKSIKFDMESWNWFGGPVAYQWSCFWYELPLKS